LLDDLRHYSELATTTASTGEDDPTVPIYKLFALTVSSLLGSSSSVASILTERGRVQDAAPGDAVLSTSPGRIEAKMLQSRVFLYSPQSNGRFCG